MTDEPKTPKTTLTDGSPVTPDHREIDPATGMQKGYVVLSDEERAKGFVRPVRSAYRHVGTRPKYPLRDLTPDESARYTEFGYVQFEAYPGGSPEAVGSGTGRFWTATQLASGCDTVTTMSRPLAETYARQPDFYGATYCAGCGAHFPVGQFGEFVWDHTDERVGT
jgi:hypothetical protein